MIFKIYKRIIDLVFSVFAIFILSPILILTAIIIRLDSKGPVIFRQERLGMKAKVFKMYKFRSMTVGAEKSGVYSGKGDSRVTRVGKIIRALSIDELPQFFNIIKGDMSLIGPRPTLTYHPWPLDKYSTVQLKRFDVRPGITGWAQINGRKDIEWNRRIEYDVEYVDNMSFKFDLKIFFRTIIKVLSMQDNININKTA